MEFQKSISSQGDGSVKLPQFLLEFGGNDFKMAVKNSNCLRGSKT